MVGLAGSGMAVTSSLHCAPPRHQTEHWWLPRDDIVVSSVKSGTGGPLLPRSSKNVNKMQDPKSPMILEQTGKFVNVFNQVCVDVTSQAASSIDVISPPPSTILQAPADLLLNPADLLLKPGVCVDVTSQAASSIDVISPPPSTILQAPADILQAPADLLLKPGVC